MTNVSPLSFLSELVHSYGLLAVKSEFEAEGSTLEELCALSDLCLQSGCNFTIKVGGPTALRDFYESCEIGASTILVPMIESVAGLKYASTIYTQCIPVSANLSSPPKLAINIESIMAVDNFREITDYIIASNLSVSTIVIGRSDLSTSLNVDSVDSEVVSSIIFSLLEHLVPHGFNVTIGGSVTSFSFEVLRECLRLGITAFETRKCTLPSIHLESKDRFIKSVDLALRFEMAWLQYKQDLFSVPDSISLKRLNSLKSRLS